MGNNYNTFQTNRDNRLTAVVIKNLFQRPRGRMGNKKYVIDQMAGDGMRGLTLTGEGEDLTN